MRILSVATVPLGDVQDKSDATGAALRNASKALVQIGKCLREGGFHGFRPKKWWVFCLKQDPVGFKTIVAKRKSNIFGCLF